MNYINRDPGFAERVAKLNELENERIREYEKLKNTPYNDHLAELNKKYEEDEEFKRYMFLKKEHEKSLNQYYNGQESPGSSEGSENFNAYLTPEERDRYRSYLDDEYKRFGHKGLNLSTVPEIEEQEGLSGLKADTELGKRFNPYFEADSKRDRNSFIRSKREQLANLRQLETSIDEIKKRPSVSRYLEEQAGLNEWHKRRELQNQQQNDPYMGIASKPRNPEREPQKLTSPSQDWLNAQPLERKKDTNTNNIWGKNLAPKSDATNVSAAKAYAGDNLAIPEQGKGMTPLAYMHYRDYHKSKTGETLPEIKSKNNALSEDEKWAAFKEREKKNTGQLLGRSQLLSEIGKVTKEQRQKLKQLEKEEAIINDGSRVPEINHIKRIYGDPKDDFYVKYHEYQKSKSMSGLITKTKDGLLKIGDVDAYENNLSNRLQDVVSSAILRKGDSRSFKELANNLEAQEDDLTWAGRHKNLLKLAMAPINAAMGNFKSAWDPISDVFTGEEEEIDSMWSDIENLKIQKLYSDYIDPASLGISDDIAKGDGLEVAVGINRMLASRMIALGGIMPDWGQNILKATVPIQSMTQKDVIINNEGARETQRRWAVTGLFKDPVTFLTNRYADDKEFKEMLMRRYEGDDEAIRNHLKNPDFLMDASAAIGNIAGSLTPAGPLGIGGKAATGLANGARRWKMTSGILKNVDEAKLAFTKQQMARLALSETNAQRAAALASFFTPNRFDMAEMTLKTAIQFGVANVIESIDDGHISAEETLDAMVQGGAMGFVAGALGSASGKLASRAYAASQTARNLGINASKLSAIAMGANALAQVPANVAQSIVGRVLTDGWEGVMSYTTRDAAIDAMVGMVFGLNDIQHAIKTHRNLRGSDYMRSIQEVINLTFKTRAQRAAEETIENGLRAKVAGENPIPQDDGPPETESPMDEAAEKIVDIADAVEEDMGKPEMFSGADINNDLDGISYATTEEELAARVDEAIKKEREIPAEEEAAEAFFEEESPKEKTHTIKGLVYGETEPVPVTIEQFFAGLDEASVERDGVIQELNTINEAVNGKPLTIMVKNVKSPQYSVKDNTIYIPDMDVNNENMKLLMGALREEVAHAVTIKRLRENPAFNTKILEMWDSFHELSGNQDFWIDAYNAHITAMGYLPGEQPTFDAYKKGVLDYYVTYNSDGTPDLIEFIGGLYNRQSGLKEAMMNHRPNFFSKLVKNGKGEKVYNDLVRTIFNLKIGKPKSEKATKQSDTPNADAAKIVAEEPIKKKRTRAKAKGITEENQESINFNLEVDATGDEPVVNQVPVEDRPQNPEGMESNNPKMDEVREKYAAEEQKPTQETTVDYETEKPLEQEIADNEQEETIDLDELTNRIIEKGFDEDTFSQDFNEDTLNDLFNASPMTVFMMATQNENTTRNTFEQELEQVIKEEEFFRTYKIPLIGPEQTRVVYTAVYPNGVRNQFTGRMEPVEGAEWASIKMAVSGNPENVVYLYDVLSDGWFRYTPSHISASVMNQVPNGKLEALTKEQAMALVPPHGKGGDFVKDREKYLEGTSRNKRGVYPRQHPNRTQDFYLSSKIFDGFDSIEGINPEEIYQQAMDAIEVMATRSVLEAVDVAYEGTPIEFEQKDLEIFQDIGNAMVRNDEELYLNDESFVEITDVLSQNATSKKTDEVVKPVKINTKGLGEILGYSTQSSDFKWTDGQILALTTVEAMIKDGSSNAMRILGYAGTGKTTISELMARYAIENGYKVYFLAPVGTAVQNTINRMKAIPDKKGLPSLRKAKYATVASFLGKQLDDFTGASFVRLEKREEENRFIIVDEASMLNTLDFKDLMNTIGDEDIIIFTGDPFQNQAVESENEPNPIRVLELNNQYFKGSNYIELTEVKRLDAANTVLQLATYTRLSERAMVPASDTEHIKVLGTGKHPDIDRAIATGFDLPPDSALSALYDKSVNKALDEYIENYKKDPKNVMMVTFSNRERVNLDREIRTRLGKDPDDHKVYNGDKIIWLSNDRGVGLSNGLSALFSSEEITIDYETPFRIKQKETFSRNKPDPNKEPRYATVYLGKRVIDVVDPVSNEVKKVEHVIMWSPDWSEATLGWKQLAQRGSVALVNDSPDYDEGVYDLEKYMVDNKIGGVWMRSYDGENFNNVDEDTRKAEQKIVGFTNGNVSTGHKAQGSQAKNVTVIVPKTRTPARLRNLKRMETVKAINDSGGKVPAELMPTKNEQDEAINFTKWYYTAVTRTSENLTIVSVTLPSIENDKMSAIAKKGNEIYGVRYSGQREDNTKEKLAEMMQQAMAVGERRVALIAEQAITNTRNEMIGKIKLLADLINKSGDPYNLEKRIKEAVEFAEGQTKDMTPSEKLDTALKVILGFAKSSARRNYNFFKKDLNLAELFIEGRLDATAMEKMPPENQVLVAAGGFSDGKELSAYLMSVIKTNPENFNEIVIERFRDGLQQQRLPQEYLDKVYHYLRQYYFNNHNNKTVFSGELDVQIVKEKNGRTSYLTNISKKQQVDVQSRPALNMVARNLIRLSPAANNMINMSDAVRSKHGGVALVEILRNLADPSFSNIISINKVHMQVVGSNARTTFNGLWNGTTEEKIPHIARSLFQSGIILLPRANSEKMAIDARQAFSYLTSIMRGMMVSPEAAAFGRQQAARFVKEMQEETLWSVLDRPSNWKNLKEHMEVFPQGVVNISRVIDLAKLHRSNFSQENAIAIEDVLRDEVLGNENILKTASTPEFQNRLLKIKSKLHDIFNWPGMPEELMAHERINEKSTIPEIWDVIRDVTYGHLSMITEPALSSSIMKTKGKETIEEQEYDIVKLAKLGSKYLGVVAGNQKSIKDLTALLNILPDHYRSFTEEDWLANGIQIRADGTHFYRHAFFDFDGMKKVIEMSEMEEAAKAMFLAKLYPFLTIVNDGGSFTVSQGLADMDRDLYGNTDSNQNKYHLVLGDQAGNITFNKTESNSLLLADTFGTPELEAFVNMLKENRLGIVSPLSAVKSDGFVRPLPFKIDEETSVFLNDKKQVVGIRKGTGDIDVSEKNINDFVLPYYLDFIDGKGVIPWSVAEVDLYGENSRRYITSTEIAEKSNNELGFLSLPAYTPGTNYHSNTNHVFDKIISNVQSEGASWAKAYADVMSKDPFALDSRSLKNLGDKIKYMISYYKRKQENPDKFTSIDRALELPELLSKTVDPDGNFMPSMRDALFLSGRFLFAEGLNSVGIQEGRLPSDMSRIVAEKLDDAYKIRIPMLTGKLVPNVDSLGDFQRLAEFEQELISRDIVTDAEAHYWWYKVMGGTPPTVEDIVRRKDEIKQAMMKAHSEKLGYVKTDIDEILNIWKDDALSVSVGKDTYMYLLKETQKHRPHLRSLLGEPLFLKTTPADSVTALSPITIGGLLPIGHGIAGNKKLILSLLGKDFDGDPASLVFESEAFLNINEAEGLRDEGTFLELHKKLTEIGIHAGAEKDEWENNIMKKMSLISGGVSLANSAIKFANGLSPRPRPMAGNPVGKNYANSLFSATYGVGKAVQAVKRWSDALSTIKRLPDGVHVLEKPEKENMPPSMTLRIQEGRAIVQAVIGKSAIGFELDLDANFQQRIAGLFKQVGGVDAYLIHSIDPDDLWYGSKFLKIYRKPNALDPNSKWTPEDWSKLPGEFRNQYTSALDRFLSATTSPKYNSMDTHPRHNSEIQKVGDVHSHYWDALTAFGDIQKPVSQNEKYIEIREKILEKSLEKFDKMPAAKQSIMLQIKEAFGGEDTVKPTPFSWFFDTYFKNAGGIGYFDADNYLSHLTKKFSEGNKYVNGELLFGSYGVVWDHLFKTNPNALKLSSSRNTFLFFYNKDAKNYYYTRHPETNEESLYVPSANLTLPIKDIIKETGYINKDLVAAIRTRPNAAAEMRNVLNAVFKDVSSLFNSTETDKMTRSRLLGKAIANASLNLETANKPASLFAGLYLLAPMPDIYVKGSTTTRYSGTLANNFVVTKGSVKEIIPGLPTEKSPDIKNLTNISFDEVMSGIASMNISTIVPFGDNGGSINAKDFIFGSVKKETPDTDTHGASVFTFMKGAKYAKEIGNDTLEQMMGRIKSMDNLTDTQKAQYINTLETNVGAFLESVTPSAEERSMLRKQMAFDMGLAMAKIDNQYKGGTIGALAAIYSKLRRTDVTSLANTLGEQKYYSPSFPLSTSVDISLGTNGISKNLRVLTVAGKVNQNTRLFQYGGASMARVSEFTEMTNSFSKTIQNVVNIGKSNADNLFYKSKTSDKLREVATTLKKEPGSIDEAQSLLMDGFTAGDIKFVSGEYNGRGKASIVMEIAGETFGFGDFGERMDKAIGRSLKKYTKGATSEEDLQDYILETKRYIKLAHYRGLVGLAMESARHSLTSYSAMKGMGDDTKRRIAELDAVLKEEAAKLLDPSLQTALDASRVIVEKENALDKLRARLQAANEKGTEYRKEFLYEIGKKMNNITKDVGDWEKMMIIQDGAEAIRKVMATLSKRIDMSVWSGTQKARNIERNPIDFYKAMDILGLAEHVQYNPDIYLERLEAQTKYIQANLEDILLAEYMKQPETNIFAHVAAVAAINKMNQSGNVYSKEINFNTWDSTPTPIKPGQQIKGFALNRDGNSDRYSGRFLRQVAGFTLIYNENTSRLFAIKKDALQTMYATEKVPLTMGDGDKAVQNRYVEVLDEVGQELESLFLTFLNSKHNDVRSEMKTKIAGALFDLTDVVEVNKPETWDRMKKMMVYSTHWWNYGSGKFFVNGMTLAASSLYFASTGHPNMALFAAGSGIGYMVAPWARNAVKAGLNTLSSSRAALVESGSIGGALSRKTSTDPNATTQEQEKVRDKKMQIQAIASESMTNTIQSNQYNSAAELGENQKKANLLDFKSNFNEFLEQKKQIKEVEEIKAQIKAGKKEGITSHVDMMEHLLKNVGHLIKDKGYKVVAVEGGFEVITKDGQKPTDKDQMFIQLTSLLSNMFWMDRLARSEIEAAEQSVGINVNMIMKEHPQIIDMPDEWIETLIDSLNKISIGNYEKNPWTKQYAARWLDMYQSFSKEFNLAATGDSAKKMIAWNSMMDTAMNLPGFVELLKRNNIDTLGLKFKNPYHTQGMISLYGMAFQAPKIINYLLTMLGAATVTGLSGMLFTLMEDDANKLGYGTSFGSIFTALLLNAGIFAAPDDKAFKKMAPAAYKSRDDAAGEWLGLGEKSAARIMNILLDGVIYKSADVTPSKGTKNMWEDNLTKSVAAVPVVGQAAEAIKGPIKLKEKE